MSMPSSPRSSSRDGSSSFGVLGSMIPEGNTLLAVPKKGRVHTRVMEIIDGIGLYHIRPNRLDVANCTNERVSLVFLPAADIPLFVSEGTVDIGITGQDIIAESGVDVCNVLDLGIGKCRLCLQAPVSRPKRTPESFAGARIVTSFPNLARKYFEACEPKGEKGSTSIKWVGGSVEAACTLGLADAVVDLVETGTTMRAAGLEIIDVLMDTQFVVISNPRIPKEHQSMVSKIKRRIQGYQSAQHHLLLQYNIHKDNLDAAKKIASGARAPTVQDLAGETGWVAVSVLVPRKECSEIMDMLEEIGANSLLALKLENHRV